MKNTPGNADSLIICTTPLQTIIAEKIIKISKDRTFDLIVLVPNKNKKYKYYFNRLEKKCKKGLYFELNNGMFNFANFVKSIKFNKFNLKYSNIYLASIDSSYCQYMISKNKGASIFTFDDGTANILPNSIYYRTINKSKLKLIGRKIFGINCSMEDIKKQSKLHYTIYKDIPNIIINTQAINLIDNSNIISLPININSENINIYLGQPLNEITSYFTLDKLNYVLRKLNITHYFPHPRETSIPHGNYQIINCNLIFEDYIVKALKANPEKIINVFSFTSSAIINISNIQQVKASYIFHPILDAEFRDFYALVHNEFKIPIVNI